MTLLEARQNKKSKWEIDKLRRDEIAAQRREARTKARDEARASSELLMRRWLRLAEAGYGTETLQSRGCPYRLSWLLVTGEERDSA